MVGLLGLSNHWAWQVERARGLAAVAGTARAGVLQYHHTYLRMRTDIPDLRFSRDGEIGVADGSILSYVRAEPGMTLVAYSPLLNGAYTRPGKELDRAYDHPGTRARLEALDQVVRETGATANQVVLIREAAVHTRRSSPDCPSRAMVAAPAPRPGRVPDVQLQSLPLLMP